MVDTIGSLIDKLATVNQKMFLAQEELYVIRKMSFEEFKGIYGCNDEGLQKLYIAFKKNMDFLFLVYIFLLASLGCHKVVDKKSDNVVLQEKKELSKEKIDDYFPNVGDVLAYEIKLGEAEPFVYKEMDWPKARNQKVISVKGKQYLSIKPDAENLNKVFFLQLLVKGLADVSGHPEYSSGVELVVKKDDLHIYQNASKIFWVLL